MSLPPTGQPGKQSKDADLKVAVSPPPLLKSPKFQVTELLTSPRSSTSGPSSEIMGSGGVRRSMGGWRGQWAQTGTKAASSAGSPDGRESPRKAGDDSDGFLPSQIDENETSSLPADAGEDKAVWEQEQPSSVLTPLGTINELPSFGLTSPAVQPRHGDVPWSGAATRMGEYDWANFVYAYARGRWDPVRSPHPPSHSNVVPGAVTKIGAQTESISRPATPEAPEEVVSIRRPSLTYSLPTQASTGEGSSGADLDPHRITRAHTPPPLGTGREGATSTPDGFEKARSSTTDLQPPQVPTSSSHPGTPSMRAMTEPNFIDPFSVLHLVSSSSPNIGQAMTLGEGAQQMMDDGRRGPGVDGAKTDSEIVTKATSSRHGADTSPKQDDSVWQAYSGHPRSPNRHGGLFPFVPPSASNAERPGLDARVSDLALSSSKPIKMGKQGGSEEEGGVKESPLRPRPTPVQHHGLTSNGEDYEMRSGTWSSAPETNSTSSSSTGIKSYALLASNSDAGTVAGLRRAARRTSMKRGEGSRDSPKETMQAGHSKSYPTVPTTHEHSKRELPSLDQIMAEKARNAPSASFGGQASRPHPTSQKGSTASPVKLSQIGHTGSNPSLATYLNVGKQVETFYRDNGYLPAIIPPDEMARRQALRRYGPPKMNGDTNFNRIAHLVKLVFNTKLVLISLVGEKTQFFQTEVGVSSANYSRDWLQQTAKSRDCSLCSHAILQQTDEALVILDAEKDWRFAGNPLVKGAPRIRFYAGSPLRTTDGHNLGSLCIIDDRPWQEFNARQRHTLREFSRVVMREMELSRDWIHLQIRDRMQLSIETLTRECLEMESSEEKDDDNPGLHRVYDFAAKGMREALNASGAVIFDLSHFELVVSPQSQDEEGGSKIFFPSPYQYPDITPFADFANPAEIEGVSASMNSTQSIHRDTRLEEKSVPPMAVLGASELHAAPEDRDRPVPLAHYLKVAEFLRKHRTGRYFSFTPAPFRHLLPDGMTSILLVPIFGLNKQPFALLCAYSKPIEMATTMEDIQEPGLQYIRAMGTIILSAILKKDIMLADKAKSHFISNISHELRTPLHGILAAAELLSETKMNATQGSYLETVEACGKSLLELVNHVLDFTKLSGNIRANQPQTKPSQECDLIKLVQEVCESSWIGQMAKKLESQQSSGIGSAYAKGSDSSSPGSSDSDASTTLQQKQKLLAEFSNVETVIDVSFRSSGWLVKCDAGGIRRVLMNLVGNSLKFTSAGFVHVSLREVQSTETHVVVELGVTDTGKGISRSFLEEQLFHPFTQENHLGPGTGLGLSIVNSIVQSPGINGKIDVWSTLGQGTEIRVTCELALSSPNEAEGILYRPVLDVDRKKSVSLVGFQDNLRGQSDLKDVLQSYYEDWWKFHIAAGSDGDIVLVNDKVDCLEQIAKERRAKKQMLPPVILLTGARGDAQVAGACDRYQQLGGVARLLFKPTGPAKLEAVTDFCLQCFERGQAGEAMYTSESDHDTPLPSPVVKDREGERSGSADDDDTPGLEDTPTPRAHPGTMTDIRHHRPDLAHDLRRNSHHISPGPPPSSESTNLLRRHSSEDRVVRTNRGPDSPLSAVEPGPQVGVNRPMMPTRSITYHEPRLQRHVLMSPLRSPHHLRKADEASDYFGSVNGGTSSSFHAGSSSSSSGQETSSPSSPGSVISLEGGEGAVLKTAIHTAGLLRGGSTKKRLQVLSVEDNNINRKVLAAFFGKMDVDFVEASNGEEGVRMFESHPPNHFDVIFMDLSMPVLDGIDATLQIRKIEAERFRSDQRFPQQHLTLQHQAWARATRSTSILGTPGGSRPSAQARAKIFALTGRSSEEDKRKAFGSGCDGLICKPVSFKVLSSLLNKVRSG